MRGLCASWPVRLWEGLTHPVVALPVVLLWQQGRWAAAVGWFVAGMVVGGVVWHRGGYNRLHHVRLRRLFWGVAALAVLIWGWIAGPEVRKGAVLAALLLLGAGYVARFRPSIHVAGGVFLAVGMGSGVMAGLALLIVIQRVVCGRHSPAEVAAGMLVGGLAGWLMHPLL